MSRTTVLIVLFCCALLAPSAVAQRVSFDITFEKRTPSSTDRFLFTFSADPYATDGVDTALSEREIPPIPLPGDVFYVWTVAPTAETIWLSPLDVRHYPADTGGLVTYNVRVNWNGGTLEAFWPRPLPRQIDSIWITDGYSDFPDNFLKVKVESGKRMSTTNPAMERFRVLIWYNGLPTSVQEQAGGSPLALYPNPVDEVLHLASEMDMVGDVKIVSAMGHVIPSAYVDDAVRTIDVSALASGMYMVVFTEANGTIHSHPFIKR
jgi:hypothetical protein